MYPDCPSSQAWPQRVEPRPQGGSPAASHPAGPRAPGRHRSYLRLRLTDGRAELAFFEACSGEEFGEQLRLLRRALQDRLEAARHPEVHLWHGDAWWNLSADLAQCIAWNVEVGRATPDEARQFIGAPWCRPDWLYEAARQMQRLLDVALRVRTDDGGLPPAQPGEAP